MEGTRVRAVWFSLDPGLRLWHDQADTSIVRVVEVRERSFSELFRGDQRTCETMYPDAVWGINDNETVPPGTEGTVEMVTALSVSVKWDNGSSIGIAPRDEVELIDLRIWPAEFQTDADVNETPGDCYEVVDVGPAEPRTLMLSSLAACQAEYPSAKLEA